MLSRAMFSMPYACSELSGPLFALFLNSGLFSSVHRYRAFSRIVVSISSQSSGKSQKNGRGRRTGAEGRQSSGGSNTGRRKSAISGQSESESEDEDLSETNELTLTNIARFVRIVFRLLTSQQLELKLASGDSRI